MYTWDRIAYLTVSGDLRTFMQVRNIREVYKLVGVLPATIYRVVTPNEAVFPR